LKLIISLIVLVQTAFASNLSYYPTNLKNQIQSDSLQDQELIDKLADLIKRNHKKLNYKTAKKELFGKLHLEQDEDGRYFVKDVYCRKKYTSQFPSIGKVGPERIPNHTIVNCEHTWPQSKFKGRSSHQKGDLHHLFPTESKANSKRSSNNFDIITNGKAAHRDCEASQSTSGTFQPPPEHRGNVARAMFYFSTRYNLPIHEKMERVLKLWHEQDPVDEKEIKRNDMIEEIQSNRNPYIDFPHLVNLINDF
jgi:deoxyribonuclease-1